MSEYFSTKLGTIEKSIEKTPTHLIMRTVGIPYGSNLKTGTDLHGDYFEKNTNDGGLPEVFVYFNHNKFYPMDDSPEELEKALILAKAFRGVVLGKAKRVGVTDAGVIYDIIIERSQWYADMIEDLVQKDALKVSSGAKFRHPMERGKVDEWHVVELSVTPTPSNPKAAFLIKSYLDKEVNNIMDTNTQADATNSIESGQTDLAQIEQAFDAEIESAINDANEKSVGISNQFVGIEDALEKALAPLMEQMNKITQTVNNILASQPLIPRKTVEALTKINSMSDFEKTAQSQIKQNQQQITTSQDTINPVNHPKSPMLKLAGNARK